MASRRLASSNKPSSSGSQTFNTSSGGQGVNLTPEQQARIAGTSIGGALGVPAASSSSSSKKTTSPTTRTTSSSGSSSGGSSSGNPVLDKALSGGYGTYEQGLAREKMSRTTAPATPIENPTYYPRYTKDEQAASDFLNTFQAPKSAEQIQREKMKAAQSEINGLNDYYGQRLQEQRTLNQNNERAVASVNTLTGLAGSTEANVTAGKAAATSQQANDKILAERQMQLGAILSNIRTSAQTEATAQRTEARLSAAQVMANRAKAVEEAVQNVTNLAKSGVTIEGLKQTDPQSYAYLAQKVGGEAPLKAMMTLNRPVESILDKRIENGNYVIAYQNPLTGEVRIETVNLGLPVGYSKTIDAGDRILAMPDDWSGDPSELVTIEKRLTPDQMADNALAREKSVRGVDGNGLTPYQTFQATQSLKKTTQTLTAAQREIQRQAGVMNDTWTRFESGKAKDLNGTSQAIITTFNKLLDPTSVVREAEYDRTPQGQALISQIEGKLAALSQGGPGLTKESLKELVDLGNTYAAGAKQHIDSIYTNSREEAAFFGLNPDFIAPEPETPVYGPQRLELPPMSPTKNDNDPLGILS